MTFFKSYTPSKIKVEVPLTALVCPNSSDHCTNLHTNEAQFTPLGNTLTTNNITDIIDTTDTTNIPETFTSIAAIGGGVAAALVVLILIIIIIIVVLILVLSKRRAEKPYQEHQGKLTTSL